ncbi:uncharacterized protein LOC127049504 [Gopherus flavomarginatus]|uniref:uncharacterized protein LOC127049504 n=1 Tax=Gopherus flavomarginatus TaxID=286002 RepID=UPI0021CC165A|nr:uncharacterized protein LOC127049504 [Gopherus flavomarginatus]
MEGTSAANFSSLLPPSRRLSQIRRRKKRARDKMFSEILESTRNERAHLNEWKDMISQYRKDASEREDRRDQCEDRRDQREERRDARDERWQQEDQRRQDATLGLLRDQTDMFWRLVELQERQQDHRVPLQPLYNCPPPSPYSIAASPRCGTTWSALAPSVLLSVPSSKEETREAGVHCSLPGIGSRARLLGYGLGKARARKAAPGVLMSASGTGASPAV